MSRIVQLQHSKQHIPHIFPHTYIMTDPTLKPNKKGEVIRMVNEEDPKVRSVMEATDSKGEPVKESDPDFDYYANLTKEELAAEFEKLSPADKIRYNEWFNFHSRYQKNTCIGGSITQIIRGISNQNKPLIPDEIPRREFEEVEFDPDQVQIERMTDKDGREVKHVKPILIKKEKETDYTTKEPSELGPNKDIFLFTDEERVPFADQLYESKSEEETDDESYVEDDISIEVDSDSSAALSMTDDEFETTDPIKIDQALQQITTGLRTPADGYETLQGLLPTLLVTEIPTVAQAAPVPYLQPLSKPAVTALQTVGEEQLINQARLLEFQTGMSQATLMRKYGIGQDRLYKAIHGNICPGGTQYQTLKKEQTTSKEETASQVKQEVLPVPSSLPKKEKGKSSKK